MTRSELIAELAKQFPQLTRKDLDVSVKVILETLGRHLAAGNRVELRRFGNFTLQARPSRKGRNPRTGEVVDNPEKLFILFKPSIELQARISSSRKFEH